MFLSELKEQTRKEINRLLDSKVVLENERLIYLKSETRVNEMINELRKMPDNDSIGSYDFRHLFKRLIIVNRTRLIFVIGSDDMDKVPLNPNAIPMMFIENYSYKVRATKYNCSFGIYINKIEKARPR